MHALVKLGGRFGHNVDCCCTDIELLCQLTSERTMHSVVKCLWTTCSIRRWWRWRRRRRRRRRRRKPKQTLSASRSVTMMWLCESAEWGEKMCMCCCYHCTRPPRWPSGKASASRAEGPGFESCLRRDFFGVESYQWLKNWHSSGYPARRLAL